MISVVESLNIVIRNLEEKYSMVVFFLSEFNSPLYDNNKLVAIWYGQT